MDFSVLIRAYNAERYLKEAVGSILSQTCGCNIEVVILYDEGSTDRTWDVIKDLQNNTSTPPNISLKVIRHIHTTPFRALQIGLKEAKGKYITILDYDNLYPPDYLEKIYKTANENKDATFIFSKAIVIDKNKNILGELVNMPSNPYDLNRIVKGNYIDVNTFVLESSCKDKILNLLDKLKHVYFDLIMDDWLIATLALKFCKPLHVSNAYVYYRVHESNTVAAFGQTGIDLKSLLNVERDIKTLTAMLYIFEDKKLIYRILGSLVVRYIASIHYTSKIAGVSLATTLLMGLRHAIGYINITQIFKKRI